MEPILWFVTILLSVAILFSFGGDTIIQLFNKDNHIKQCTKTARNNVRVAFDKSSVKYRIVDITPFGNGEYELHGKSISFPVTDITKVVTSMQLTGDLIDLMWTGRGNIDYIPGGLRTITDNEYEQMIKTQKESIRLQGEVDELKASARKASQMAVDQAAQLAGTAGNRGF